MGKKKSRKLEKLKPKWGSRHEKIIVINKKRAAVAQLEAAIYLWFYERDIVAIHALVASAHDCLAAMCSKVGKKSPYQKWLEELSNAERSRFKYVRDFIAHGNKDPDDDVEHSVHHTEALLGFSCDCYRYAFSSLTPLMELFVLRDAMEDPIRRHSSHPLWIKERFGHDADNISRTDFLAEYLPVLNILAADDSVGNIQFP